MFIIMELFIMGIGKMTINKVMVYKNGLMALYMKGSFIKGKDMEKGNTHCIQVLFMMVVGKLEN